MKRTFDKFGYDLEDPETSLKLNTPKTYEALYDYKTPGHPIFRDLEETAEEILKTS